MMVGLIGLGILAIIAGIAFAVKKNNTVSVAQSTVKADLELIEHEPMNLNYFNYVTGTIKNNTQKTYEHVQVQLNIYNNDVLMGTTTASANNLHPGAKWRFQAPVLEQGGFKYKITSITGY